MRGVGLRIVSSLLERPPGGGEATENAELKKEHINIYNIKTVHKKEENKRYTKQ